MLPSLSWAGIVLHTDPAKQTTQSHTPTTVPSGGQSTPLQTLPPAYTFHDVAPAKPCFNIGKPTNRALLIGLNHLQSKAVPSLNGPGNDLDLMVKALQVQGVADEHIVQLRNAQASRQKVLEHLKEQMAQARCGDTLFLHFSGMEYLLPHSDQAVEVMLVLYDSTFTSPAKPEFKPGLWGRELRTAITLLRNRGVFVFVSLDSCHAAALKVSTAQTERIWSCCAEEEKTSKAQLLPEAAGYSAFYATGTEQLAMELQLPLGVDQAQQKHFGQFSFSLATTMLEGKARSFQALAERVNQFYQQREKVEAWTQDLQIRPQFESTHPERQPFPSVVSVMDPLTRSVMQGSHEPNIELSFDGLSPMRGGFLALKGQQPLIAGRVKPVQGLLTLLADGQPLHIDPEGAFRGRLSQMMGKESVTLLAIYRNGAIERQVVPIKVKGGDLPLGQQYALIIGNRDYADPAFKSLVTPLQDAQQVAHLLHTGFGFKTSLMLPNHKEISLLLNNATRRQITSTISKLRRYLKPEDSLLIYYAGHGWRSHRADQAYWLPVDAEHDDFGTYLSASFITDQVRMMSVRHILIISDSCYSGAMNRGAEEGHEAKEGHLADSEKTQLLAKLHSRKSRMILSSGSDEPVADQGGQGHSVFARALLEGLNAFPHRQFAVDQLFSDHIQEQVAGHSEQSPQLAPIHRSGHEGGRFIFRRGHKVVH
ncbi:caspase family protein [Magnetococcus sp. PR-3]|uniref:caspase family protein n=1 Tax=Magnetococcus sp. PR-3 TaxID=3120355 RepID=UPI002FCE4E34